MISVVIPTFNSERTLAPTLTALVPACVQGIVREVIVVDGGSDDHTCEIADASGAAFVRSERGRGPQLAAGAAAARHPWLLFLHADTFLEPGWEHEAAGFIESVDTGERDLSAAAFRFALDDVGAMPRVLEKLVGMRCLLLRVPYGDQGLLIPKRLYDRLGGYRDMPLMEDVDLVRRLGRGRVAMMRTKAITNARRYKAGGYLPRMARNLACMSLYCLRVPPRVLARIYG